MRLTIYIVRRLLFALLLMLGVSLIIFFLVNAIGDPIELMMAETPGVSAETIVRTR